MASTLASNAVVHKTTDAKDESDEKKDHVTELNDIKPLRKMASIRSSLNEISLDQQDFSLYSGLMEALTSATSSLRMNRRIEQAYLQQIREMFEAEKQFTLGDLLTNINSGMQVIVDDDFSLCFKRPERRPWNFNVYLFVFWSIGVVFRYLILFPLRLLIFIIAILLTLAQFWIWEKIFPNDPQKQERWELWSIQFLVQIFIASWGGVIEYKGVMAPRKAYQIYVANHTTMLDWLLLMQMTPFCVVGQLHTSRPMVGWFQTKLLKSLNCIWFNRSEQKDKTLAMKRIKEHIADVNTPRLLIFPEGTCVNNEYCIQFKKGAFSLNCEICPVAIKYNPSFIDAYWISRERSFPGHLMDIMTSWAMVAEVTYLEPIQINRDNNETPIQFSSRCKGLIAKAAGLKNVEWNGYLKHYKPSERIIDASKKVVADNLNRLYETIKDDTYDVKGDGGLKKRQKGGSTKIPNQP